MSGVIKVLLIFFLLVLMGCKGKSSCIVDVICKDYESKECEKFYQEAQKNCGKYQE